MAKKEEIADELKNLGSILPGNIPAPGYEVPAGYFEDLAAVMLRRVRALEANSPADELAELSPMLSGIPKQMPNAIPPGYFDTIDEQVYVITNGLNLDTTDVDKELETLSPLLGELRTKNTYTVPPGYFENLASVVPVPQEEKETARVVPFFRKSWVRYAAAAVVLAFIATFALVNRNSADSSLDPATKSFAWVEKNLDKVSTDEIARFVEQVNGENAELASTGTTVEISSLLKDVSDKEIADFLQDTQFAEANGDDDILLN
jgi:hypothetical protein